MAVAVAILSTHGEDSPAQQPVPEETGKTEVRIANFTFSPREVTVPVGTTVTWTNHDDVPHVVASVDDEFKKSGALDTGDSFSHRFTTAGTFVYFCSIHPHMTGKILVKWKGSAAEG
jgi:plastocyanin